MNSEDQQPTQSIDELLPPTAKRRVSERIPLKVREFPASPLDQPLDPWKQAPFVKIRVMSLRDVQGLSLETRRVLLGDNGKSWSGGASRPLPDGWRLVFLNPTHSRERQAATLMEEICHVVLGHSPSRIQSEVQVEVSTTKSTTMSTTKSTTKSTMKQRVRFRDFNETQEEVAYAVGAA